MQSSENVGAKIAKKEGLFYMSPRRTIAQYHHTNTTNLTLSRKRNRPATENTVTPNLHPLKKSCMTLVNIQGLITNNNNKCQFLFNQCCKKSTSNIIAITETWLTDTHDNSEILKTFKDYSINRSDRKPANTPPRGGCLLLTSPDIVAVPRKPFSNGYCELAITDMPSENLTIVVVYNPPPPKPPALPESSLEKFSEVINNIRTHLLNTSRDILLCGDFNFPKDIVEWIESEEGIFAHQAPGHRPQKVAFDLLMQLANEFNLTQTVSRPTRHNNILDLIFTSPNITIDINPPIPIAPASDHNVITSDILFENFDAQKEETASVENASPSLNDFHYLRADKKALKNALNTTDWETLLQEPAPVEELTDRLINAVFNASTITKDPQRKQQQNQEQRTDPILDNLQQAKNSLEKTSFAKNPHNRQNHH